MFAKLASAAQVSFIHSLQLKLGVELLAASDAADLTMASASSAIEQLKADLASAAVVARPSLVDEGIYRRKSDDSLFRVQTSEVGRRYAKLLLTSGGWGYERGAIYTLAADERMTLAQLEEWGVANGVCAICSRLLSTPESVARGIGPVCAKRY